MSESHKHPGTLECYFSFKLTLLLFLISSKYWLCISQGVGSSFPLTVVNTIQNKTKKKLVEISLMNSNLNKSLTILKELSSSAIHSHLFCKASVEEMMQVNFQRFEIPSFSLSLEIARLYCDLKSYQRKMHKLLPFGI